MLERHLLNLCDDYNLKRLVSTLTRATANSDTLIDVIRTSKKIKFLHAGGFNPGISDDHLVSTITRAACPKRYSKTSMRKKFTAIWHSVIIIIKHVEVLHVQVQLEEFFLKTNHFCLLDEQFKLGF